MENTEETPLKEKILEIIDNSGNFQCRKQEEKGHLCCDGHCPELKKLVDEIIIEFEDQKKESSKTVFGTNNLVELDIDHSFWSEALSTIHRKKLIELCEKFNIPTKSKNRYRLASNLSKRIDLNKRMKIIIGFENNNK